MRYCRLEPGRTVQRAHLPHSLTLASHSRRPAFPVRMLAPALFHKRRRRCPNVQAWRTDPIEVPSHSSSGNTSSITHMNRSAAYVRVLLAKADDSRPVVLDGGGDASLRRP